MERESIALSLLPDFGCRAFREAVGRHGSAAASFGFHGTPGEREAASRVADGILERVERAGGRVLVLGERGYPAPLLDLADAPGVVYAIGDIGLVDRTCVGIVGTRHASAGGERLAHALAGMLVGAGAVVVSGMAFGIDAAAHRGALEAGGSTIAVLGGGADLPYPPAHTALHARIVREGLVLSEAPLGRRPGKGAFPRRNRIIAALSEVLVVVEAGERSGALITAGKALDLGRVVAALPGPIDSPRHVGTNRLLADGAQFVTRLEDVLELAKLERTVRSQPGEVPALTSEATGDSEERILAALRTGLADVDLIAVATQLPPRQVAAALSILEISGRLSVSTAGQVMLAGQG